MSVPNSTVDSWWYNHQIKCGVHVLFLFICRIHVCTDTVGISDSVASHEFTLANNESKGCGRKQSWSNLIDCPGVCLEELVKTTDNLIQDRWCPGGDSNTIPLEDRPEVLLLESTCSEWRKD